MFGVRGMIVAVWDFDDPDPFSFELSRIRFLLVRKPLFDALHA